MSSVPFKTSSALAGAQDMLEAGENRHRPKLVEAFTNRQLKTCPPLFVLSTGSAKLQVLGAQTMDRVCSKPSAWCRLCLGSMWRYDSRAASEEGVLDGLHSGISSRRAAQGVECRGIACGAWLQLRALRFGVWSLPIETTIAPQNRHDRGSL